MTLFPDKKFKLFLIYVGELIYWLRENKFTKLSLSLSLSLYIYIYIGGVLNSPALLGSDKRSLFALIRFEFKVLYLLDRLPS